MTKQSMLFRIFQYFPIWTVLFLIQTPFASPDAEKLKTQLTATYWEEEIPILDSSTSTGTSDEDLTEPSSKAPRPLVCFSKYQADQYQENKSTRVKKEMHKLRTNFWQLSFASRDRRIFPSKTMIMDFDKSGFCLHKSNQTIGKWRSLPSGLTWQIPLSKGVNLHFSAEVVLNPYGKHPKMLRGTVIRDRFASSWLPTKWFRPVVGAFEAEGIGEDLLDLTYEDRGFGFSQKFNN
mmetsp:Transcript_671/g.842  ORF Transcript_671/g.842 Transcript_671/m.842 type:complete len:235 (-) Transcript_671:1361-2065(-)